MSSCDEVEERLEAAAASAIVYGEVLRRKKHSVDGQRRRTRERKRGRQERRAGILGQVLYRRNSAAVSRFSGERFLPDGGVSGLDSRGRKERRVRLEWEGG
jgi:hypothetical protein